MTLRQYLILMSVGTFICWATWLFIVFSIDPATAGSMGLSFFYLSLFLSLVGSFSVIVFLLRRLVIKNNEVIFRHVKRTFRQSVLVSLLLIFALFLMQWRLLAWWNAGLLLALFIILETFIFTNRRYRNDIYVGQFEK
ncbi:MAG: hypothetical protein WCT40_04565 [Candidatus Magasanikbacteria bacterium]